MLSEYINSAADNMFSLRMHESGIRNGKNGFADSILRVILDHWHAFLKFVLLSQWLQ